MKKLTILLMFLFLILGLIAQESDRSGYETVKKLETERDIAQRAENLLYPFVGKTIVRVDLDLRYPSDILTPFGMALDRKESLPGLPVARSKGVLPSTIDNQETYPTFIVKKKITVFVDRNISKQMEEFIRENLNTWLKINPEKGDELEIKKTLNFSEAAIMTKAKLTTSKIQILMGLILLIIFIIFLFIFNSGIRNISSAMRNINIAGLEKTLRFRGNVNTPFDVRGGNRASKLETENQEPLPIKIVSEEEEKDSLDFSFLEKLSIENFFKITENEKLEDMTFVLSKLSRGYVREIFKNYSGDLNKLISAMINQNKMNKKRARELREKLFELHKKYLEEENIQFSGIEYLVNIINNLPAKDANEFYEKIKEVNEGTAAELRTRIFLLEDILKLSEEVMEELTFAIDHELLIRFLASVSEDIKEKFFNALTSRAAAIYREDMELLGELSDLEKENAINQTLMIIRKLLNYI